MFTKALRISSTIFIILAIIFALLPVPGGGRGEQLPSHTQSADPSNTDSRKGNVQGAFNTSLRFTHLTINDGLSHSDVRSIAQDRRGFMWFGTWLGGLNRYDGYSFKVYKHDPEDKRSLNSDSVRQLFVDHLGNLWISVGNAGIDRYDPDTDSFVHYSHQPNNPDSLPSDDVSNMSEDDTGTMWVGSGEGLSRFDRAKGAFFTYRNNPSDPHSLSDNGILAIVEDRNTGLLWLGTKTKGVCVFDRSNGRCIRYSNNVKDPVSLSNNTVPYMYQDHAGDLWFATVEGLDRFNPKTHTFTRYLHDPNNPASISDSLIMHIHEDRAGRFWVLTNNGLNLMDRQKGTFTSYVNEPGNPNSLSSNVGNFYGFWEDTEGAIWIGTRSTGIDRIICDASSFVTYHHNPLNHNSLGGNGVHTLTLGKKGELWLGTESSLDRFDGKRFIHYVNNPKKTDSVNTGPERWVVQDFSGTVWTGTYGGGLCRMDAEGHFTHFINDPKNANSPARDNISGIVPDPKGGIWFGAYDKGIDYFDGKRFTHYLNDPNNPNSAPDPYMRPIWLDRQGMLWIVSFAAGLVRFDTHSHKFKNYLLSAGFSGAKTMDWIEDLYFDGKIIWIASGVDGLFCFDPVKEAFTHHYTEKNGLASNSTVGVQGDLQGNIWVSTSHGLSRFDPKSETFRNYDVLDGFQGNVFLRGHARSADGLMFVSGTDGFSTFNPNELPDNLIPPPVVFTNFELSNKPVKAGFKGSPLKKDITVANEVTLRYDQSVFSIRFAALNYNAPQKNRYAYKLVGFDKDWQYTDYTRRYATYTNLNPGVYTLRVKASNNDGVWNEKGILLNITITPPWWATIWFRSIVAIILLTLVYAAYRLRIRSIEQRSLELERQVNERTTELAESNHQLAIARDDAEQSRKAAEVANRSKSIFLANMSHELRTPLNAVLGFSHVMINASDVTPSQKENLEIITRSGEHLMTLINNVLDISKIESGRVELVEAPVDLHQMMQEISSLMGMRARGKGLEFVMAMSPKLPPLISADGTKIRQVLINLVGNAIKYTTKGDVTLRAMDGELISVEKAWIRFEVADSGPGIRDEDKERIFTPFVQLGGQPNTEAGTGLGLAISKQYVELMGGRIEVTSKPGAGAVFHVQIPVTVLPSTEAVSVSKPGNVIGIAEDDKQYRILIAEDQPENRLLLHKLLEPFGFGLQEASNGEEAVAICKEWHPHLIFMDIRMPVMDGLEATRRIKADDAGTNIKIIAVTAHALDDERNEIMASGCDYFLGKPYKYSEIMDVLTNYLGIHFIYEDEKLVPAKQVQVVDALQALPVEILNMMEAALVQLDTDQVTSIIERIRDRDSDLADTLTNTARDLQYGIMLRWIRDVNRN